MPAFAPNAVKASGTFFAVAVKTFPPLTKYLVGSGTANCTIKSRKPETPVYQILFSGNCKTEAAPLPIVKAEPFTNPLTFLAASDCRACSSSLIKNPLP